MSLSTHLCGFLLKFPHMEDKKPGTEDFEIVADILKQMTDASRIRIFWLLCHRSLCVQELAQEMGMSSPAVSHHLRQLRMAGLIAGKRQGKEMHYHSCGNTQAKFLHEMIEALMDISCP